MANNKEVIVLDNEHGDFGIPYQEVISRVMIIRNQRVLLDHDVAQLYGVQTKAINQAVRNNPDKFPQGYILELSKEESTVLRSKFLTLKRINGKGKYSKFNYKAFTEKGLYMLATILKSPKATLTTIAIIETFEKVRYLKRELIELHQESDKKRQSSIIQQFGKTLTDLVMPDLQTQETESSIEINFMIGKIKHTVKRIRKEDTPTPLNGGNNIGDDPM
ncbi:MAG: ORF6N domain-containing protein [Prevotella sp.]|nr:ORF6N domain-containing protein [Prevotella sp.]